MEENFIEIKEIYEKIKRDLDIKRHDLENIESELKDLGIKNFNDIDKKIKEIETEIKKGQEKVARLITKAQDMLKEYEE